MNRISIGLDNGLSPVRRQAITWTNAGLLPTEPLGTYFSEIWIGILSFSFKKMQLKISSAKLAAILSRGRWVNSHCRFLALKLRHVLLVICTKQDGSSSKSIYNQMCPRMRLYIQFGYMCGYISMSAESYHEMTLISVSIPVSCTPSGPPYWQRLANSGFSWTPG